MTVRDSGGNVFVDFVWGNMPMQPNADREEGHDLDPALDSHIIATSQYEGFPLFIQGAPYDDTIDNREVPNLLGQTGSTADGILAGAGLTSVVGTPVTSGATSENNGTVATQSPDAGIVVNAGDSVTYALYNYVVATNPIAGMRTNVIPAGWSLNSGEVVMYLLGRTVKPTVGQTIHTAGTGVTDHNQNFQVLQVANNDSFNTGGTAVKLTPLQMGVTSVSYTHLTLPTKA